MTWPAFASSIAFTALALALLALCGLLLRAGQRRAIAAVGYLAGAAFFIGFLLWAFHVVSIPPPALLFSLIATFIVIAVLRPGLRYAGQWVAIGIGTLVASIGALPDLLGGTRAIRGTLIVAGIYVIAQAPGLIGKFLASRRRRATTRWWSPDDGYDLLIYLFLIAAMAMPSLFLASLMAGLAVLVLAWQLRRRRR